MRPKGIEDLAAFSAREVKRAAAEPLLYLYACQEMVMIMFKEDAVSEINKIPLSDNTIKRVYIQDMSGDIECNMKSKILK